jgi:lipopolysaccharide transport system ATP-binding protein
MSQDVLIQVEEVSKKFCRDLRKSLWYGVHDIAGELLGRDRRAEKLRSKEFWALRDISFQLKRGESLGLIGPNGAGKSTLLKLLNGLVKPDQGRIVVRGRMGALIELGAGFNPILTGRENIFVNAAVLGIPKRQVDRIIHEIIDFAELEEFIDAPVQSYSSGMRVRLGFAVAAQLKPDILIVDEVLAVGDAYFRRKCISYMKRLFESGETTVILVSHNLRNIEQVCGQVIYLDRGQISAQGQTDKVISQYLYNANTQYAEHAAEHAVQREGSGEVRFTEVAVRSARTGTPHLEAGDPVTIQARFKSFKPVKYVRFRIGIQDFATQTLITIANIDARDLDQDGEIICTFPDLHLLPRTYSVYLSATDLLMLYERQSNASVFAVHGSRDDNVKFSVDDPQLIHIPYSIEFNFNHFVSNEDEQQSA